MTHETLNKPGPHPTPVSQPFWDAAEQRQLRLQHCADCDHYVFYPRQRCPYCWSAALDWRAASGRGVVASFVGVYKPGHPAFAGDVPYVVALIDLEEGPRLLSNIVNRGPEDALIGQSVEVIFEAQGDTALPKFQTTDETPA
ncbi:Zn-ribbon domain-containing OB-fold protein [Salinisphaera aquimarina]|uniref:Zn-ribbon domain-containing OB-fold protein n=1 Tax=Salinisphaera aquimarina TaxID=2094031 RepID=A0ABV7EVE9_9GAMM